MNTFTRFLPTLLCLGLSAAYAEYQEGGDGNVTFEAEAYHAITVSDVLSGGAITHDWVGACPSGIPGSLDNFTGDAVMFASPEDDATKYQSAFILPGSPALDSVAPRMDYRVDFTTTGTYYIWVRMWTSSGESNSIHMGVDGAELASAARILTNQTNGQYVWVGQRVTAADQFVRATLDIGTAGAHTINVWLRESGVYIDAIHLTTDANFDPNVDPEPVADANVGAPQLMTLNPAFDPDGGPVDPADTAALSSCTPGATLYFTTDGVTDPTENPGDLYSAPFSIPADDTEVRALAVAGGFADSAIVAREFDSDQFPTLDTPIGPQSATQGVLFDPPPADGGLDISTNFSDPDGDPLTFSMTGLPVGTGMTISGAGFISGTPTNDDALASPISVTVTATDPETATASDTFVLTVTNANDAPTISGTPATSVAKNVAYSFTPTAADIDGDTLLFTVANNPGWLSIDPNTGVLSGTPGNGDVGTTTGIVITVDDQQSEPNSTASLPAFDLTVTNQAPTFTSTAVTAAVEGFAYTYNITTSDSDVGETLAITASTKPAWLTLSDNGDGTATLSGTPATADIGSHPVELVVTDASGATASQPFTVVVDNVNDAPVISGTPATTVAEDTAYSFTPTASDVDGDTLVFSITNKPAWASFNTATGALTGTPTNADVGITTGIVITADDQQGEPNSTASLAAFDLTVTNVNDAPSFTSTAVTTATQDVAYSYPVTSSDVDAGDSLVVTATTLPTWLTLTDSGTGSGSATLSGTPTAAEVGDHPVVLEVSDGSGGTDTQSFTVTVAAASTESGGGGGGGCALNPDAKRDPTLPLLILTAAGYLLRRRRSQQK
jgi:hypothetical protein